MEVTITIEHAERCDTLEEAVVEQFDCADSPTSLVEIGLPEDPVVVDWRSTPLQSAGTTIEDVCAWLHAAGKLPCRIYDGTSLYTLSDPADYDPEDTDWTWIDEFEEVEIEIEWPEDLPSSGGYDVHGLRRLAEWAKKTGNAIDENLKKQAQDVLNALS